MLQLDCRHSVISRFSAFSTLLMLLLLATPPAWAARVTQVKNGNCLIDLEGSGAKVGDKGYLLDGSKKKAIVQITQVKNGRALGRVNKGSAQVGYEFQIPGSQGKSASRGNQRRIGRRKVDQVLVGGLVGYSMDNQSVTLTNAAGTTLETVAMTGAGFNAKALVDVPVSGGLGLMGRFGVEMFNLTGSSTATNCTGSASCTTSITYLTGDMLLRYEFMTGDFAPFVSAGLGLHFPLSKSTNILDPTQITTTPVFFGGLGFYWRISDDNFIPFMVEYGYFSPSSSVSTYMISARLGYATTF